MLNWIGTSSLWVYLLLISWAGLMPPKRGSWSTCCLPSPVGTNLLLQHTHSLFSGCTLSVHHGRRNPWSMACHVWLTWNARNTSKNQYDRLQEFTLILNETWRKSFLSNGWCKTEIVQQFQTFFNISQVVWKNCWKYLIIKALSFTMFYLLKCLRGGSWLSFWVNKYGKNKCERNHIYSMKSCNRD